MFIFRQVLVKKNADMMYSRIHNYKSQLHVSFLADVHKPSVAHRDLSSSNVLVRAGGTCVLCDFGCATILRSCLGQMTNMEVR